MLYPRIIPCLLIKDGALVKTLNFQNTRYIGDPINAVKIFNEKKVDELIVLDIKCSNKEMEPQYELIQKLAGEARMPLCYGGGIKRIDQIEKIIRLGVEKVAMSSSAIDCPSIVKRGAEVVGSQSIVVVIDSKKNNQSGNYEVWSNRVGKSTEMDIIEFARKVEHLGAGEILLSSVDRDGTMTGYDMELAHKVYRKIKVPLTILGGAGSLEDITELIRNFGIIGAAAGSLFVFKGKYRAVLISYPGNAEKKSILAKAGFN